MMIRRSIIILSQLCANNKVHIYFKPFKPPDVVERFVDVNGIALILGFLKQLVLFYDAVQLNKLCFKFQYRYTLVSFNSSSIPYVVTLTCCKWYILWEKLTTHNIRGTFTIVLKTPLFSLIRWFIRIKFIKCHRCKSW